MTSKPKTETVSPGIDQIPFEGIEAIGEIFAEGEPKYGRDNWKRGVDDTDYDQERCRHAMRHLWLWSNGDRSEDHLAKVGFFVVTQLWRERRRQQSLSAVRFPLEFLTVLCFLGLHKWLPLPMPRRSVRRYLTGLRKCERCGKEQLRKSTLVSSGRWEDTILAPETNRKDERQRNGT